MIHRRPGTTETSTVEQKLGHAFSDPTLLKEALTHGSWSHENGGSHNERLEFLGDSVLNTCTTMQLMTRFPEAPEGVLSRLRSRLVNTDSLADIARRLDLGRHLKLGRGEESTGGRDRTSVLADALEAVLGALFLDAGFDGARAVVERWMTPRIEALDPGMQVRQAFLDPKGRLQEFTQAQWKRAPDYVVITTEGPEHDRTFTVEVRLDERVLGLGRGATKREASRIAAEEALHALALRPSDGPG